MEAIFIDKKVNRITYKDMRFNEADDKPGTWYPGATTILQCAPKDQSFYEWLKKYGNASDTISMEAMEKGSVVHRLTELYDRGEVVSAQSESGNPLYSSNEWEMFNKYVEFSEKYKPEVIVNESSYCLSSLGYGGTLDRVINMNGETWLLDIKTGNMYEYYWMQLAAYKRLFEEWQLFNWGEIKNKIDKIGIIHLNTKTRGEDKKGKSIQGHGWCIETPDSWIENKVDSKDPIKYYLSLFESVKHIWNFQNPSFKPFNRVFALEVKKTF